MSNMKANIYAHQQIIGIAELQITDESMGVVAGNFLPTEHYDNIKKVIWEFHDLDSKTGYNDLNNLRLNAQLENELFLFPLGGFLINDIEALPNEIKTFEAVGIYRHIIEDCFLTNLSTISLPENWELISIEQKIAFEDELAKEIGIYTKKHKLNDFDFCAIATSSINDDVLFAIHKQGGSKFNYAVIHLTWRQKFEDNDNFTMTEFFEDFNHFLNDHLSS